MRAWAGRAILLFAALSAASGQTCMLRGTVADRGTHKPLPKTRVFAINSHEAFLRTTDEKGGFCFEAVDAGVYQVVAEKTGYLDSWYKGSAGARSGQPITVEAGRTVPELRLEMVARAILSGVVVDGNGDPVAGVTVTAYRGARRARGDLDQEDDQDADDRGNFRFANLPPGTYYLGVESFESEQRGAAYLDENGRPVEERTVQTYYPGGTDLAAAKPIVLEAGHDVTNLMLPLRKTEKVERSLAGKVSPKVTGSIRVAGPDGNGQGRSFQIEIAADGSFSRGGLYPAHYVLTLRADGQTARAEVDLTAGDARNIVLTPHPTETLDVPLKILTEGSPPYQPPHGIWAVLMREQEQDVAFVRQGDDGGYVFRGVLRDVYRLAGPMSREGYYLKRVRLGGRTVEDKTIDLRGDASGPIELLFSTKVARISGRVVGESTGVVTVVVKADGGQERSVTLDQEGHFAVESLPPGRYRLWAIEYIWDGDWDRLAPAKSTVVEVGEGERKDVELALVK